MKTKPQGPQAPKPHLILPSPVRAQEGIGLNPGDTVRAATGQGFVMAIVKSRDQHLFNVRIINGPEALKRYPAEVRLQLLYEGKWIDSHVIQSIGMEYQVALPGDMAGWARPEQIKYVGPPPEKVVAKAGQPPRPGLVSCAGKLYITIPGEERALELDLNDDGSLQAPFGELKKKAK